MNLCQALTSAMDIAMEKDSTTGEILLQSDKLSVITREETF